MNLSSPSAEPNTAVPLASHPKHTLKETTSITDVIAKTERAEGVMTTPSPETTSSPILKVLDSFQKSFLLSGRAVEIQRSAGIIFPTVDGREYDCILSCCDCPDIEVWYIPGTKQCSSQFYAVCKAHHLQLLGRALRTSGTNADRTHRQRKSGYTTTRWYRSRGL